MDYSKKTTGGTRWFDALKIRTLMTGNGKAVAEIKDRGAVRAERVELGIRQGAIISDEGLAELRNAKTVIDQCQDYLQHPEDFARPPFNGGLAISKGLPVKSMTEPRSGPPVATTGQGRRLNNQGCLVGKGQ